MVNTSKQSQPNYARLWQQCLQTIREKYGEKYNHWYDVWFGGMQFERYDAETRQLVIQVPSKYVYEYMETHMVQPLREALSLTFKEPVTLSYRIMPPVPSFADMAAYLQRQSGGVGHNSRHIHIDNARQRVEEGLRHFLKDKPMQWIEGYDDVVRWLDDNDDRGLLVVGTPGLGKSLICQKVLPVLLSDGVRPIPCVSATELHKRLEELKQERIVIIDDLGKEPRKHYGEVDRSFLELCDNAERTGAILVITTNLSTTPVDDPAYPDSILNRYGEAVISRLKAIAHVAAFHGSDMRG